MSYSFITVADHDNFSWNYPYTNGDIISDFNDLTSDSNVSASMPAADNIPLGTSVFFNNIGNYNISIYSYGTDLIVTITPGSIVTIYSIDNSSAAGKWRAVQTVGGSLGITALSVTSNTSALVVDGSPVLAGQSGDIQLDLNSVLDKFSSLNSTGLLVSTDDTGAAIETRTLIGGDNIVITNNDGVNGNIRIELTDSPLGLTSLNVGDFSIQDSTITANDILNISTTGTGNYLNLNGVQIDSLANISSINNLTLQGDLNNAGKIVSSNLTVGNFNFTNSMLQSVDKGSLSIATTGANSVLSLNNVIIDITSDITGINNLSVEGTLKVSEDIEVDELTVGNFNFTASTLSSVDKGDILISTSSINSNLHLNNVLIDTRANVTGINDLSIVGTLKVSENAEAEVLTVGNFNFVNSTLYSVDKGNLSIDTIGVASVLSLNNVTIDTLSNIKGVNDFSLEGTLTVSEDIEVENNITTKQLTIGATEITENSIKSNEAIDVNSTVFDSKGNITTNTINANNIVLNTPYVPPGSCSSQGFFSDNNTLTTTPTGNTINLQSATNIMSVVGANGLYNVTFDSPYIDSTYVVQLTLSNSPNVISPIAAFFTDRTTTGFNIIAIDYRGNLIPVTAGICFSIWGEITV